MPVGDRRIPPQLRRPTPICIGIGVAADRSSTPRRARNRDFRNP
jgi:hypothetical protein